MSHSDIRNFNRFIPREDVSRVSAWDFGAVDEGARAEIARAQAAAEAERQMGAIAERLQQAHDAGFESGFADGAAQAAAEAEQRLADYIDGEGRAAAERMAALHDAFALGLDAARERMARGILDIACALARQVVRRELAVRPDALEPVVREALAQLMADGKPAVVRLHPQDHAALSVALADAGRPGAVAWLADAAMPAGDCQVESAGTVIDGRVASRWARALAPLGLDAAWDAVPAEQAEAEQALRASAAAAAVEHGTAEPAGAPLGRLEAETETEAEADADADADADAAGAAGLDAATAGGPRDGGPVALQDDPSAGSPDGAAGVPDDAGASAGAPLPAAPAAQDDPFAGIDFDSLFDANTAPPPAAAPPEPDDAA